ncbi:hypothetical protein SB659_20310, partial [Arthrobacter sp. SIMBA_036]|uniref:hypothetical protein n=1 Tax=Arthrobacter sp. SIMBA_036 TaxID=3085778 RepID=UPI00397C40F2
CNFGWDWGPTLVTAGIWKPVRLESWDRARLAETRVSATLAGGDGRVTIRAQVAALDGVSGATVVAEIAGVTRSVPVDGSG